MKMEVGRTPDPHDPFPPILSLHHVNQGEADPGSNFRGGNDVLHGEKNLCLMEANH